MYYQVSFNTPANTPESEPVVTTLKLTKGRLVRVLVGFAPGAVGLLHIKIRDKGFQIAPLTMTESLAWDNYVYDLALNYALQAEPFELTVLSWNDDDSYEHGSFVGVEIHEGSSSEGAVLQQYPLQGG